MNIDKKALGEILDALWESRQRERAAQITIKKLYAKARRELGLTTPQIELEIIRHRESVGDVRRLDGSRVYFLRALDADLLKIGVTRDLDLRVKALGAGIQGPVRLVGSIDGDGVSERTLHYQFRQHRQHGEFFSWVPISEQVRGLVARNSALLHGVLQ